MARTTSLLEFVLLRLNNYLICAIYQLDCCKKGNPHSLNVVKDNESTCCQSFRISLPFLIIEFIHSVEPLPSVTRNSDEKERNVFN